MSNVRQRMVTMFGASAVMQAHAEYGRFRVNLSLPLIEQE